MMHSAVAPRPLSNIQNGKQDKAHSPETVGADEGDDRPTQGQSKSQHQQYSPHWMGSWSKKQIQFQRAESKERDTTVVIDEEEENEYYQLDGRISVDKSKLNFSSIAYPEQEKSAQQDAVLTGQTLSNSRSQVQTTATMSKNRLNAMTRNFLAPRMQGTAEFRESDDQEREQHNAVHNFMHHEERHIATDNHIFQ